MGYNLKYFILDIETSKVIPLSIPFFYSLSASLGSHFSVVSQVMNITLNLLRSIPVKE